MLRPWQTKLWLENTAGDSLHARLVNQLTEDIQAGRLGPGTLMPGTRSLAQQLGVNRKTVQLVYEELEAQGWLVSQARRGTFVADVLPEQGLSPENRRLVHAERETRPPDPLVTRLYSDVLAENKKSSGANDGIPDVRLIPYELLARAYRRALLHSIRKQYLGYGDPRGTEELRSSIQKMLTMDRFMKVAQEEVCVVRGSQMGIFLAARALDPKSGVIVFEELSYPPALAAFESNGFEIVRCKLDGNGLDLDDLQRILNERPVAGVYTTPHHQYPTTVCMSMERRLMLLKLSAVHGFAVIEDDYDHEFHFETRPIPPLASLPFSGNVIHIGSMSKVFAPGLRLGYLVADKRFVDRVAQEILLIDRQGNPVTELAVSDLMESGEVKKHIRKTRRLYESRRNFAAKEFERVFGDKVSFELPAGGMALWVNFGKLLRDKDMVGFRHTDFNMETHFGCDPRHAAHARFGFGALDEEEISKSIGRLSSALMQRDCGKTGR